ncbi:hypothetical protein OS493_031599 [Desmophyllum pertusum]|uniref:Granulins domain-containing protein n=1 Tax=Desmophyllum pertusum TaxID=174260 RepID=A0A9W9YJM6_9CNID|nr:hypothetical protein OS493_031599 [Desmophyllum pertusum]
MAMLQKIPASKIIAEVSNVVCPDESQCPDGSTCCQLASGQYGCCPLPKAVCCSDHVHCCPNGYTCSVANGTCSRGSDSIPMLEKIPASKTAVLVGIVCPDGASECPDGYTCCRLLSGQWGCCPLPQAVCCSDGEHCCPNGYTCNGGSCTKGSKRQYGCCPLPNAVCCSDGVHCCPNGYTCDVSAGTCSKGSDLMAMLQKIAASKRKADASSVVCPDGQSQCPDGNTCCKLSSGQYGCCPLPNAVCCSDGVHCCPNGYTCDVSAGTCSKGSDLMAMLQKIPASKIIAEVSNVVCPDGSQCPDGSTCCQLASGQYGCCPLPKAVCCSDHVHCCPNGYTCSVANGTCSRGSDSIPMLEKIPASKTAVLVGIVCPDGASECPDGNTCCRLVSGQWGCCPLPQAVCCSDGEHCCPNGYTCNGGSCTKGSKSIPMLQKIPASKRTADDSTLVGIVCPDKKYQCPNGSTCCKLPSGTYGCCPLYKAVCCSDGKHCCPEGYTCDVKQGRCNKTAEHINMIDNIPALSVTTGM